MAISYVGGQVAGRANPSSAVSVNFALTNGSDAVPSAGDLVIVCCVTGSAAGNPAMAITTPNDYTALGQLNQSAVTADTSMDVSYKRMGASPDTAVTIPGTGNNAFGEAYSIQVFRGVDATTPMDVAAVAGGGTGTGRPNPGSINTVTPGVAVVICGGGAAGTGANYTAPANYTTDFVTAAGADTTDAMVGSGYRLDPADPEDPAVYTGGTTGANDSWTSYTIAIRPAAEAVSLAISGNAGTSGLGSFAKAVAIALTGVAAAGSPGTFGKTVTHSISGNAATGDVGTVEPSTSYGAALGGNEATGSVGSLTVSVSRAVSGNAGTGSAGSVVESVSVTPSGNSATGSAGSLTVSVSRAVSGNAGTGSAGSLVASISAPLSGNSATGAVGTLVPVSGSGAALSGNAATGSVGTLTVSVSVPLVGVTALGSVGTLAPPIDRWKTGARSGGPGVPMGRVRRGRFGAW